MPITEEQMSHDEMEKITDNPRYKCGECGGGLTLAWGGSLGYEGYILRCGNNVEHSKISKYNKKEEEFKQMVREQSDKSSTALMEMTEAAMVERVDKAKFVKDLTVNEKELLAVACITYGFDPIMHELTIFQGNPFVSVDGRYRKAQETGKLDGMECRPATEQERKDWEIPDGDKFFRAECYVKGAKYPFVGWGRVLAKEMSRANEYTPLATNPQRMAEKRAEVQALRKAFHIPLPSSEYIGVIEEGAEIVETSSGKVNTGTGEIVESEVLEVEPGEQQSEQVSAGDEIPQPVEEVKGKKVKEEPLDESPVTGKDVSDLKTLMEKAGMSATDIGQMMKKDLKWPVPKTFLDLKKWQMAKLVGILTDLLEK